MKLITNFPRHIATPQRRTIYDRCSFINAINNYNGIKDVYYSVYQCNEFGRFDSIRASQIDKIFFDFDSPETALQDAIKLMEWCVKKQIECCCFFSGKKGFHVYVKTEANELKHPRDALYNAHNYFIEKLGIDLDIHVRGDTARVARIPNTWHPRGNRYCYPLKYSELSNGLDWIKEQAKKQRNEDCTEKGNAFNIERFDCARSIKFQTVEINFDYEIPFDPETVSNFFPPYVLDWLRNADKYTGRHNRIRHYFAAFCKDNGLPPGYCNKVAEYFWSMTPDSSGRSTKYKEFCTERHIEGAYRNDLSRFPSLETLRKEGFIDGEVKEMATRSI